MIKNLIDKVEEILRKQFPYALFSFLFFAVLWGALGQIFGGYADWGTHTNGNFYLGDKIKPSVVVQSYQYWLSVGAMWLIKITAIWLIICLIFRSVKKKS